MSAVTNGVVDDVAQEKILVRAPPGIVPWAHRRREVHGHNAAVANSFFQHDGAAVQVGYAQNGDVRGGFHAQDLTLEHLVGIALIRGAGDGSVPPDGIANRIAPGRVAFNLDSHPGTDAVVHVGFAEMQAAAARVLEEAGDDLPPGFRECGDGVVVQHPQVASVIHHGDYEFMLTENACVVTVIHEVQAFDPVRIKNVQIGPYGAARAVCEQEDVLIRLHGDVGSLPPSRPRRLDLRRPNGYGRVMVGGLTIFLSG